MSKSDNEELDNSENDESLEEDSSGQNEEFDLGLHEVPIDVGLGIFDIFPRMTYKPWIAIGEYVDNSIQSFEENKTRLRELHGESYKLIVEIIIDKDKDDNQIIIIQDNAAGISRQKSLTAFRLASKPEDLSGLSQYGIGMKSASLWFSRNFMIITSALGEDETRTVRFNKNEIVRSGKMSLNVESERKTKNTSGTRIILRELNHPIPMNATLGKIRSYLASMYRDYLRSGEVEITVANQTLEYFGPEILESKYWPSDKGPDEKTQKQRWTRRVTITLNDSWAEMPEDIRPPEPPVIKGWVGILGTGNARLAGLALIWKRKVVVGTGSGADSNDDTYKPASIFGAVNSFASQRLSGELDVSQLEVTGFKDSLAWSQSQEQEFIEKLKTFLSEGDQPILRMLKNYRSTVASKEVQNIVQIDVDATTRAIPEDIVQGIFHPTEVKFNEKDTAEPSTEEQDKRVIGVVRLPDEIGKALQLEVKQQPGDPEWLRVVKEEPTYRIILNRSHPFMNSFVNLPGADIEPIIRIAAAIGLAEITAKNAGYERSSFIRRKVNELLSGELSSRTGE